MATLKRRLYRKNSSGTYDIVHLETSADLITGTLPISHGGTGATAVTNARANLGAFYDNTATLGTTDFNTMLTPGSYRILFNSGINQTTYHSPYGEITSGYSTVTHYNLLVFGVSTRLTQICASAYNHNRGMWYRFKHDSTFSPWYQITSVDDIPQYAEKIGDIKTVATTNGLDMNKYHICDGDAVDWKYTDYYNIFSEQERMSCANKSTNIGNLTGFVVSDLSYINNMYCMVSVGTSNRYGLCLYYSNNIFNDNNFTAAHFNNSDFFNTSRISRIMYDSTTKMYFFFVFSIPASGTRSYLYLYYSNNISTTTWNRITIHSIDSGSYIHIIDACNNNNIVMVVYKVNNQIHVRILNISNIASPSVLLYTTITNNFTSDSLSQRSSNILFKNNMFYIILPDTADYSLYRTNTAFNAFSKISTIASLSSNINIQNLGFNDIDNKFVAPIYIDYAFHLYSPSNSDGSGTWQSVANISKSGVNVANLQFGAVSSSTLLYAAYSYTSNNNNTLVDIIYKTNAQSTYQKITGRITNGQIMIGVPIMINNNVILGFGYDSGNGGVIGIKGLTYPNISNDIFSNTIIKVQ